jgi:hypothetical protein
MFKFGLLAGIAFLAWSGMSPVQAKEYRIPKGSHFAEGALSNAGIFLGKSLEFSAAFNETNIYTLPGIEQADVNKLYGVSDCGRHHMETSARFGWRWYQGRLEVLAFTHSDGTWKHSDVLGVAELGRAYSFKIELSSDRRHYLYTFNNGTPVKMERGCSSASMAGYILNPYFGGTETAPHDMQLSIWREERANFTVEKFGANPLREGEPLKLWMRVAEPLKINFEVFSVSGQLVHSVPEVEFDGSTELQEYTLELPTGLASGLYLIRPSVESDSGLLPGYLMGTDGESLKVVYLK